MDYSFKFDNTAATLNLQVDGKVMIARLSIEGMPLQPRDNLGGLYPTAEAVKEGLMRYGIQFVDWFPTSDDYKTIPEYLAVKEKLQSAGIFPESYWYNIVNNNYTWSDGE